MKRFFRIDDFEKHERIYLFSISIIYIAYCLYKSIQFPIFIDEAVTYNWFTSKGILTSATYYPSTNNHILFSLITNVSDYLPFGAKLNMRIPNLLIGLLSSLLVYYMLRKKFNFHSAVIGHTVFTFSYTFLIYTSIARGYILYILFSAICFYCIDKYLLEPKARKYRTLNIIAAVLGLYAIPTFIYVVFTLFIFQLIISFRKLNHVKSLVIDYTLIGVITACLYIPILYFNGYNSIMANNEHLASLPVTDVLNFLRANIRWFYDILLGVRSDFILILYFIALTFLGFRTKITEERKMIGLILLLFGLPFIFVIIQGIIPISRMWCYLIFPFVFGLSMLLNSYIKNIRSWVVYVFAFIILCFQLYVFNKSHPKAVVSRDIESEFISELVLTKKYESFYFKSKRRDEECIIRFNYLDRNEKFMSSNYYFKDGELSYSPMEFDYDCIVVSKLDSFNTVNETVTKYEKVYSNNEYNIYGKMH